MAKTDVVFNDKRVKDLLKDLTKKLDNIQEKKKDVIAIFSAVVFKDVMKHFAEQKGPNGGWAQWSPKYAKYMASIGKSSNNILQDTGRLRQSFGPTNYRVTKEGITWYNNAKTKSGFPYAAAHNNDEPRRTLPRREFMWLSSEGMQDIRNQIVKYLG